MSNQTVTAWDGENLIDLYAKTVEGGELIHTFSHTVITHAQFEDGKIQFRMETDFRYTRPICQYITVDFYGVMAFRDKGRWFVPGDTLFDTLDQAVEYLEAIESVTNE